MLKSKLLDLEIKERDYINKIINLETFIAHLSQAHGNKPNQSKKVGKTSINIGR